jgi:tetrapyrrole methylase family protein / MazG family protein
MKRTSPSSFPGIYLMGLGPGDPGLLTRQAWNILVNVTELYLRTGQHPVVEGLPRALSIISFDHLYETGQTFDEVYEQIIEEILKLGTRPQGVVYAVPGHPFIAEATSPEIYRRARERGIPVHVIEGISSLASTFSALGIDPLPQTVIADALEISARHVPLFPPDSPALIAQIYSRVVASNLKLTLAEVYPDDHPVQMVHAAGTAEVAVEKLALYQIDQSDRIGLLTTLYLPPLGPATSFESFQEVIAHLRAPDGCPWDREQDHQSLRPHLLEEAYEVLEALDTGDPEALAEELGDLLLQIVLHAQIANEYGEFRMADVFSKINQKLISRHPHVFGDLKVADAESVVVNWERLKAEERERGKKPENGMLDSVSKSLPALVQAQTYQLRAARVGFDWPSLEGVLDKILEEVAEIRTAAGEEAKASEIGDLLFALVNLARWQEIDAESALRQANHRFKKRFAYIEAAARAVGKALSDYSLDELERFWQEAKKTGSE